MNYLKKTDFKTMHTISKYKPSGKTWEFILQNILQNIAMTTVG